MSRRWRGRLKEGGRLQWHRTPTEHSNYSRPCSKHQLIHSSFNPYQNQIGQYCGELLGCTFFKLLFKIVFQNFLTCEMLLKMSTLSSHLNQNSSAQFGLHQRFSHPACSIGSRAVHLGVVLSREGPTTMSPPSTICVHNNLPTCNTSISLKSKVYVLV